MRGFTVVELIVVLALLAILSVTALPAFNSRTPVHELGLRDQIVAMVQYSRKLAVVQNRGVCLLITPSTPATPGLVQAVYVVGNACSPANWVEQPNDAAAPFTAAIPEDVVMGGAGQLRFDANGRLVPNVALTITLGMRNVTVANETSLVTYR